MNIRAIATLVLYETIIKKQSFNPSTLNKSLKPEDKAFATELCYGTLRNFLRLACIVDSLLTKPLKTKDFDIYLLILVGIYQLEQANIKEYAAINETVAATIDLNKVWAKGLINAILRNFIRQKSTILEQLNSQREAKLLHPNWLINTIETTYPEHSNAIFEANNTKAPLYFRINTLKTTVNAYLKHLDNANLAFTKISELDNSFKLTMPIAAEKLPFFNEGHIIIQDLGAQFAAYFLDLQDNQTVLDCCAAPGNKTAQIYSAAANLTVTALEKNPNRMQTLRSNCIKHGVVANLINSDINHVDTWWNKQQFDRILLDAPCSATGVIRRHPEIKLLRTPADIQELVFLQQQMLTNIWPTLKTGGILLYVTCSILQEENSSQIQKFLHNTANAKVIPIDVNAQPSLKDLPGLQLLPKIDGYDGMYFCKLQKT